MSKKLSGAEFRKRRMEKQKAENDVLRKVPKMTNFLRPKDSNTASDSNIASNSNTASGSNTISDSNNISFKINFKLTTLLRVP